MVAPSHRRSTTNTTTMERHQDASYDWGYQQQTGESTDSSFEDHIDNGRGRMNEEGILRSISHLLTQVSADTYYERNGSTVDTFDRTGMNSTRSRRRRRQDMSSAPSAEDPLLLEQQSALLQPLMVGIITPDSAAPDLIEIPKDEDFDIDDPYFQQFIDNETEEFIHEKEQEFRSRSWANQKLAAQLYSHPKSLRTFCVQVFQAAKEQSVNHNTAEEEAPHAILLHNNNSNYFGETESTPYPIKIPRHIVCENIIVCVALDSFTAIQEITLDVSFSTVSITVMALDASVHVAMNTWVGIKRFNPFSMMGIPTEVVVSGIQSVATGVGSASSLALNRLSVKNRSPSSTGLGGSQGNLRRVRSPAKAKKMINQKLLQKLNSLNSAAPVVSYTELGDNDGGLSKHAKNRVQRMMHYDVSLRPFVATIQVQDSFKKDSPKIDSFPKTTDNDNENNADSGSSSPLEGPFMCTPQSFPPTPASRSQVLRRGSRFADDVVFLARDQLRVHDGLESSNERTREMAQALTHGKRLAVFDADDACAGIDLSCGQHVATKVGNLLYCSSRSMVPILRNCFVYFEMTVLGRSGGLLQPGMATLSFGLSTKEMPSTTLVGAWKGSVGLCTTGQILISGQWCSPGPDPSIGPFGDRETVGCLVCLDDSSAFETWEGVMITATVIFNINGRIVSPQLPSAPISGPSGHPLEPAQTNIPVGALPPSCSLPLLVPAEEELFPTLTLHSPGTSVMCRFSAGDVTARSRDAIGAPPKVAVYAVDGSIVFNGEE